jgi:hypothetical protein
MRALLYRSGPALLAASLLAAIAAFPTAAAAEEIGKAVKVIPQVRAFPLSGSSYDLQDKGPIERGLTVKLTGKSSYLRVALRLKGQSMERSVRPGQQFSFTTSALLSGRSEVQFGDREEPSGSKIHLILGQLWLAMVPGEPPVEIVTPEARASVKGTYLRILVDPAVGTFIAVSEGTVTVQAKAGGAPVEVAAGQEVLVPSGGLPQPPTVLGPGGAVKGLGSGEPFLDPPVLQGDNSTEPPPGDRGGPP